MILFTISIYLLYMTLFHVHAHTVHRPTILVIFSIDFQGTDSDICKFLSAQGNKLRFFFIITTNIGRNALLVLPLWLFGHWRSPANNNGSSQCFVPSWHTVIRRVRMDKLLDTFKEKSQANVLILAHLCAADRGGKRCPPLSSARLHLSVTELWAQTRRRRRWMVVARLEIVEKRHSQF